MTIYDKLSDPTPKEYVVTETYLITVEKRVLGMDKDQALQSAKYYDGLELSCVMQNAVAEETPALNEGKRS